MNAIIEELEVSFPAGGSCAVRAVYEPTDPFAVQLQFNVPREAGDCGAAAPAGADEDVDQWTTWVFARDLLALGMNKHLASMRMQVGEGTIALGPGPTGDQITVVLCPADPGKRVVMYIRRAELEELLVRSVQLVPFGQESTRLDLDEEFRALLRKSA
ncbi:SsgA family sporulation/cell division regulator (plasmid) [Streptosporangium sp. CA-135522]|uniref:SsgA family sporulation/cell division regulator n=1 Tax=Streptosporangium sp. CA-135522 TaxID=3240072 RepID=UPI003D8B0485